MIFLNKMIILEQPQLYYRKVGITVKRSFFPLNHLRIVARESHHPQMCI